VDGIERDLKGKAEVIRLDILSGVGREVAARYGVPAIPTVLVLNRTGDVVYRQTGMPDRQEVVAQATAH
jgi:hypothetical protein